MERIQFKYHPNIYDDDILVRKTDICQCCGKQVNEYIEHLYTAEEVDCICLQCVSNGMAAKKFDAEFVSYADHVSDPEKWDELFHRTPGYLGWQDDYWLACCDDYCQYLGRVGIAELDKLGIKDEVLREYVQRDDAYSLEDVEKYLYKDGDMSGYLFKCIHCGKYHLWVDAN
ncbi:hypothetical protein SAMN02745111_02153 [Eubacterium uniforme]|uniref:CbrC family protein n=1 Tax=Eubacterium uniforme TaxID=39495 RepID=A0A1T4W1Q3_9FIRM|nr:CbrC family protein [Eubacterium uniforme]SKA71069.1 hypothetical protein SAMN02745111_02153 [Eubacterium uniforme]